VTDFGGGVRMRSTFEVVEEEPGQVTFQVEGPMFEVDEHIGWETTLAAR
jgi:hypothetical protein